MGNMDGNGDGDLNGEDMNHLKNLSRNNSTNTIDNNNNNYSNDNHNNNKGNEGKDHEDINLPTVDYTGRYSSLEGEVFLASSFNSLNSNWNYDDSIVDAITNNNNNDIAPLPLPYPI